MLLANNSCKKNAKTTEETPTMVDHLRTVSTLLSSTTTLVLSPENCSATIGRGVQQQFPVTALTSAIIT
jgi:hypothetical protein